MTEAEWLTTDDPQPLYQYVQGQASERKLRLWLVAVCRAAWADCAVLLGLKERGLVVGPAHKPGKFPGVSFFYVTPAGVEAAWLASPHCSPKG